MVKFEASDLIRIPVGIVFLLLSVTAIRKSIESFGEGAIGIIVGVMGIVIAVIFIGIGGVMALGCIGAGRRK